MKSGDLVIYIPKDTKGNVFKCEIGKIKRIDGDAAFVYFHSGETASKTNISDLIKIENQSYIEATKLGCNIIDTILNAGYYEDDGSYTVELKKAKVYEMLKKMFNADEVKLV